MPFAPEVSEFRPGARQVFCRFGTSPDPLFAKQFPASFLRADAALCSRRGQRAACFRPDVCVPHPENLGLRNRNIFQPLPRAFRLFPLPFSLKWIFRFRDRLRCGKERPTLSPGKAPGKKTETPPRYLRPQKTFLRGEIRTLLSFWFLPFSFCSLLLLIYYICVFCEKDAKHLKYGKIFDIILSL